MQGLSGLASISGRADQPPTAVGTAVIDHHGATLLALGVLGALLERQRTGSGVRVEVGTLRAALDPQMKSATYFLNGARLERTEDRKRVVKRESRPGGLPNIVSRY